MFHQKHKESSSLSTPIPFLKGQPSHTPPYIISPSIPSTQTLYKKKQIWGAIKKDELITNKQTIQNMQISYIIDIIFTIICSLTFH